MIGVDFDEQGRVVKKWWSPVSVGFDFTWFVRAYHLR
jgi:hypothetical protein